MLLERARIYAFPLRQDGQNRLTIRDKLDLHAAGERIAAAGLRCVIGRDRGRDAGADGPEDPMSHDFVQFVRAGDGPAAWTVVRCGRVVRVWHGTHGPDLGVYPTLAEAVHAALSASSPRATPADPGPAGSDRHGPKLAASSRLRPHRTGRSGH